MSWVNQISNRHTHRKWSMSQLQMRQFGCYQNSKKIERKKTVQQSGMETVKRNQTNVMNKSLLSYRINQGCLVAAFISTYKNMSAIIFAVCKTVHNLWLISIIMCFIENHQPASDSSRSRCLWLGRFVCTWRKLNEWNGNGWNCMLKLIFRYVKQQTNKIKW